MSGNQNSIGVCYLPPRAVATGSPTGDALENIISFELGDGALCFVSTGAGAGGWQFERAGSGTSNGVTIVQPIAGPGRWFRKWVPGEVVGALPSLVVDWTNPTGPVPKTCASFDTPAGQGYLWLITGIVGIENDPAFLGAPTEVAFIATWDSGSQPIAVIGKLAGPSSQWFSISKVVYLPADKTIEIFAAFTGGGYFNVDSTPDVLKYSTSLIGGSFTVQATSTYP